MEIKKNGFLMPPHPLTDFEIQKYQNESIFNGVCSRDNLQKIKDGSYVATLLNAGLMKLIICTQI